MKDRRNDDLFSIYQIHYAVGEATHRNFSQFSMKFAVYQRISQQLIQCLFNAQKEVETQPSTFAFVG